MLFQLSDSIEYIDLEQDLDTCHAIENILTSVFAGTHVVVASRNVLRMFLRSRSLSARSRAAAKKLLTEFAENDSLMKSIGFFIRVEASALRIERSNSGYIVPLACFANMELSARAVLVCENLTDCKLYEYAAMHYRLRVKLRGIGISSELAGGGGTEIVNVYERKVDDDKRAVLCVTDSDRSYPDAPLGDAARKCSAVALNSTGVTEHLILESRELENTLPHEILKQCEELDKINVDNFLEIVGSPAKDIVKYVDCKSSTTLRKIIDLFPEGSSGHEYWRQQIILAASVRGLQRDCLDEWCCNHPRNCGCVVLKGLGPNAATSVLRWIEGRTEHKSAEACSGANVNEWLDIGRNVFEWCCAKKRMRT